MKNENLRQVLDENSMINEAAFEKEYKLLSETGIKESALRLEYEKKLQH